jgi:hypothetical protein
MTADAAKAFSAIFPFSRGLQAFQGVSWWLVQMWVSPRYETKIFRILSFTRVRKE